MGMFVCMPCTLGPSRYHVVAFAKDHPGDRKERNGTAPGCTAR